MKGASSAVASTGSQLSSLLASADLFRGLPSNLLGELADATESVSVPAGETLFEKGDPGDSLYVVVNGFLHVLHEQGDLPARVIREVGRGGSVGEMALLLGGTRSATVRAVRETELLRLSRAEFERLLELFPSLGAQLARTLAGWLVAANERRTPSANVSAITLVAAHVTPAVQHFAQTLVAALAQVRTICHITKRGIEALWGQPATEVLDKSCAALRDWLAEREATQDLLVYEAEADDASWTAFCLQQADRVLWLAVAESSPPMLAPRLARAAAQNELVLLHERTKRAPTDTRGWPGLRDFSRHHHVRMNDERDCKRVARHLTGTSVGLVLGGGGVRGFAHLGVMQALDEAGIPIDIIGGTSIGAFFSALRARGDGPQAIFEMHHGVLKKLYRSPGYTLPVVSLMSGRNMDRMLAEVFADQWIEDLWLPFFCASTNLSRAELVVHRAGPLRHCIHASLAVPGILPPIVTENGELLVDGGLLNNLPCDVMRQTGAATVIAVDVTPESAVTANARNHGAPSPWRVLSERVMRAKHPSFPTILQILQRSSMVGSLNSMRHTRSQADIFVRVSIPDVEIFDWQAAGRIKEVGYRGAQDTIASIPR